MMFSQQSRRIATSRWPGLIMELNRHENDYDPEGWLPAEEVPTAERLRAYLEQSRTAKGR